MIDINEDKKLVRRWQEQDPAEAVMDTDDLMSLVIHGFEPCEDYCGSRELHGQENCFCVRANFPSQSHYFLYLELRRLAKNLTTFALLAEKTKKTKKALKKPIKSLKETH